MVLAHHGKGTLASTSHQRPQVPCLLIRQWPGHGPGGRSEVRHHLGIQTVGFGQFTQGTGKIPHLAGVDHGHWNTRSPQDHSDGDFIAPRSLQHYQVDPLLTQRNTTSGMFLV